MKILFTRFPLESANGGAENQTMWLMEGLVERGYEVGFLGSCPVLLERTKESRVTSHELRVGAPPVTKFGVISFLWRKTAMKQQLIKKLDSLMTHDSKLKTIVMLSLTEKLLLTDECVQRGINVIWIEHDRIGRWLTWNPWLGLLRRQSKLATTVCVSELSRKKYLELGWDPTKTIAIANGVPEGPKDKRQEATDNNRQGTTDKKEVCQLPVASCQFSVGCLARLSPEKGIDILIHSLADIPEVSLTVVGQGPDEGYLHKLISEDTARLGMSQPRIILKKSVDDLDSFYASLDVLVLPSTDHDPFGLVAAEAMMRGIPVIVADACGIAGYLKNDVDALIVPAGNSIALNAAIKKVLNPELRQKLSVKGVETASQQFSVEKMVEKYQQLLTP